MEGMRKEIDLIDREMAELFEKRMRLSDKIAEYKRINRLPVCDEEREREMLERNAENVSDDVRGLYLDFLKETLALSKRRQNEKNTAENEMYISSQSGGYPVIFGRLGDEHSGIDLNRKCLIVTDTNIPDAYTERLVSLCRMPFVIKIEAGEKSKNEETLFMLLRAMLENNFDRTDCVIALGGGVSGDISAAASSLYMRGIDFYNIPTSLLAMVDSSVGGKTAVDFCGVKNAVGTFYSPKAVLIDVSLLKTLPEREFNNGMAEVIKTAALFDEEMFSFLEKSSAEEVKNRIADVISACIGHKKRIVEADEKEKGLRRVLNFGHTLGHAVESCDFALLHGECISLGMLLCSENGAHDRLLALLNKYSLVRETCADKNEIIKKLLHDKKTEADEINLVKVRSIGSFRFEKIPVSDFAREILK